MTPEPSSRFHFCAIKKLSSYRDESIVVPPKFKPKLWLLNSHNGTDPAFLSKGNSGAELRNISEP